METIRLTLRYAIRSLLRQPGFAALAVLTLAVGIGVNTVAFTVVNALSSNHSDGTGRASSAGSWCRHRRIDMPRCRCRSTRISRERRARSRRLRRRRGCR